MAALFFIAVLRQPALCLSTPSLQQAMAHVVQQAPSAAAAFGLTPVAQPPLRAKGPHILNTSTEATLVKTLRSYERLPLGKHCMHPLHAVSMHLLNAAVIYVTCCSADVFAFSEVQTWDKLCEEAAAEWASRILVGLRNKLVRAGAACGVPAVEDHPLRVAGDLFQTHRALTWRSLVLQWGPLDWQWAPSPP